MAPPDAEAVHLGEVVQRSGKVVTVWAQPGDLDVRSIVSNPFAMVWPPRSGRVQQFPELDRAAWLDVPTARRKLAPAQVAFLDRLEAPWSAR